MGANSSKIKTAHLGMPHGTAQNQLRKSIIFHLIQRLHEDICFKCHCQIKTVEELSIERKVPWLHGDPALFWDLNNIAFSHLKCNKSDRFPGKQPQPVPPGQAWCVGCQDFLDSCLFWKSRSTWNGLQKYCRDCQRRKQTAYRERRKLSLIQNDG